MDTFFILADQHARSALHDVAFSARPDAPVLPYVEPRHRTRRLVAFTGGLARSVVRHGTRPVAARSARAPDCQPL